MPLSRQNPQSTLDTAGQEAARIAELFYWMVGGGFVIWLAVVSLAVYAYFQQQPLGRKGARRLIVGGGVVFPTLVLTGLLTYGLSLLPVFLTPAPEGALRIQVTGYQWWWRVRYLPAIGQPVDLANEIRLPVGAPVEFLLDSGDVIHSFWIPALGGKMDMIPGHRTRLRLAPTRTGTFRGACAEYCGASHAWMAFPVIVQEVSEFERWLAEQAEPAHAPREPLAARGAQSFVANGCGACHTLRGTTADGVVAPDLTHVGSRTSIGAGRLENERGAFSRWVAHTQDVKPGALMPSFHMLPEAQLLVLATYLESLK
jgi:cytochrome c oxidase subunit 2